MTSICQRCFSSREYNWNVHQAEIHIGQIEHWKIQLCLDCTSIVEQAIPEALKVGNKYANNERC